ncbi:MAG: hypothetical protein ACLUI3_05005 [Christensenellales bacterium]
MRKKTIGQAFAFAAPHCAVWEVFICLFGLQNALMSYLSGVLKTSLFVSGNIRRAFRA